MKREPADQMVHPHHQAHSRVIYRTSISRLKLQYGLTQPDAVQVVRETPMDTNQEEQFYHPAVQLLDYIERHWHSCTKRNDHQERGHQSCQ